MTLPPPAEITAAGALVRASKTLTVALASGTPLKLALPETFTRATGWLALGVTPVGVTGVGSPPIMKRAPVQPARSATLSVTAVRRPAMAILFRFRDVDIRIDLLLKAELGRF
ncbi:hypothetical protein D3C72_1237140 [compost metagenome]